MSPELSTSCQAHTESLTTIPCSLGHHTELPEWLKLVGIVQHWGHLPVTSHRALTSQLKGRTLSHSRFPSKNSSNCPWPSHRTCQVGQLEGADHSKLKQLQFWLSQSVSNHHGSLSRSCRCSCFYTTKIRSCSYSFRLLLQTHPLTTQH